MNFSTNVTFSNSLTKNGTSIITYSGFLFQNNSDSVTIVFGFGENWSYTTEQLMTKTENGFVAEVDMLDFNVFNFCFRNSNNEWDNNNNQNYISPILEPEVEPSFIINEDILTPILENLIAINTYEEKKSDNISESVQETVTINTVQEKVEEITSDKENNNFINIEDSLINKVEENVLTQQIESMLEEIYEPNSTSTNNLENDTTSSENPTEKNENIDVQNLTSENTSNNEIEEEFSSSDKQALLDEILSTTQSEKTNEENASSDFNMNSLISEILAPIVNSSLFETEDWSNDSTNDNISSIQEEAVITSNIESNESNTISEIENGNIDLGNTIENSSIDVVNEIESESINNDITEEVEDAKVDDLINNMLSELYNSLEENNIILENTLSSNDCNNYSYEIPESNISEKQELQFFDETEDFEDVTILENNSQEIIDTFDIDTIQLSQEAPQEKDGSNTQENLIDNVEQSLDEVIEESLIDSINADNNSDSECKALTVSPRSLNKFYIFKKKVKLAVYKFFSAIPKILSSNFEEEK